MTKFDTTHNDNTSSTLDRKRSGSRGFYVLGILIISLMAFAPVVDAGCSCSGGTWDPSGFLNAEFWNRPDRPVRQRTKQRCWKFR